MRRTAVSLIAATLVGLFSLIASYSFGGNVAYEEGVEEIPGKDGEFQKYIYKKGAFYGYADKDQQTPRFYNMSYEFKRKKTLCRSPQLNEQGDSQGWELSNLHVRVNYDDKGQNRWENLSELPTTGIYYSGNHKTPTTGKIEGIVQDGKGGLLFKVPGKSKYAFLQSEVQEFLSGTTKETPPKENIELKRPDGKVAAVLNMKTHEAEAGPGGMYIGVDLLSMSLDLGRGLKYQLEIRTNDESQGSSLESGK